ncbi:MAG: hybrid sensor histidine kinase/response regulator, partial [Bacteroidota bacterium]
GDHLLKLIDDIIDMSKLEAGLMQLEKSPCVIRDLAESSKNQFLEHSKIKHNNIRLLLKIPDKHPNTVILTDQTKLRQILTNLIYNAIKFTDKGHVEISYEFPDARLVRFCVSDTGRGIPSEKISTIFDRFMQASDSSHSASTGAGLGLALCKSYVSLLGGEIGVESSPGNGSRFCFTIPYNPAEEIDQEIVAPHLPRIFEKHLTILIAEDDTDNYLFLENVLKGNNFKLLHAVNGKEAVKLCRFNHDISLVLMDLHMPVTDGLEATKEIKTFKKNLPVIAQTAFALDGDRQKALDAGCDDYISKPIKINELLEKIYRVVSQASATA